MSGPERGFRAVFETTRDPMAILDGERRIREANGAAAELLAREPAQLRGCPLDELIVGLSQEERLAAWEELLRTGHLAGERTLARPDGTRVRADFRSLADTPEPGQHLTVLYPTEDQHREADAAQHQPALTRREREIVHRLALGQSGPEIAAALVVSPTTVRTHIQNAMEKFGARTRAHLIAIALRDRAL